MEVLEISIDRISRAVRKRVGELPKNVSYRDKISAAIDAQLMTALGQQDAYTAAAFRVTTNLPPTLRRRQLEMQRGFGKFWRDLLSRAQKAGEIDSRYHLSVLRMQLLGSISWSIEWYRPGGPLNANDIAAQLADMLFDGVTPKSSTAVSAVGVSRGRRARGNGARRAARAI